MRFCKRSRLSILVNIGCCLLLFTSVILTSSKLNVTKLNVTEMMQGLIVKAPHKTPCTSQERKALINTPLNTSVRTYVKTYKLESTGCFTINADRPGIWRLLDGADYANITCGQTAKRFKSQYEDEMHIALSSIPGAGVDWVRHLIEETTGVYTGSIYGSSAVDDVFKAEHTIYNVIAVKTHAWLNKVYYDKAVILVRDPFDAVLSNMNRELVNKTGIPDKADFDADEFRRRLLSEIQKNEVVQEIKLYRREKFILFYHALKKDMMNSLTKLVAFCNGKTTLKRLYCTLQNSEGSFHRGEKPAWMSRTNLIDDDIEQKISNMKDEIRLAIKKCKSMCATNLG